MVDRIRDTIKNFKMLKRGDTVCVAVSGGVDSTVLLDVLASLKEELCLELVVCHLNHNLRGRESERDFRFVKELSARLGLKFEGKKIPLGEVRKRGKKGGGESLQEWARTRRLAFLEEAAGKHGARRIAVGHNRDDQAETVLMRFIKGSGLRGLTGMREVRDSFIRPLIDTPREEIERYAKERKIKFVTDSSNRREKYLRNRLRLELIPLLEEGYNPKIREALARTAFILKRDEQYLSARADRASSRVARTGRGGVIMDRKKLLSLDKALSSRVFIKATTEAGGGSTDTALSAEHVEAFFGLIKGERPNACISLPGRLHLRREYEKVILASGPPPKPKPFGKRLAVPGTTEIREAGCLIETTLLKRPPRPYTGSRTTAYFDYDALAGKGGRPLRVRSWKEGDRMRPLGMKG
ncbi:MAG: tRNA lysidine(34) synthetase TilS, partial [Thermodesulfobacteriota bacterium]